MSSIEKFGSDTVSIDSEIIETLIGANTKFKGSVSTDKPIRIDGSYEGDIDTSSKVIISESGKFNGTIQCAELTLDGYAEGEVTCTKVIRIANVGQFNGKLTTANIIMQEGSLLDGTVIMKNEK